MPPKVTVIVPNFNHAPYLARRLQSVLGQTYRDFEVLYLDDASTDGSAAVAAPYLADPRVRSILNKSNSGSPFKQWNRGVREARGEYVWIAESDDHADARLLESLVGVLERHPRVSVAYCRSWKVDGDDRVFSSLEEETDRLEPGRWDRDHVNSGRDECRRFMPLRNVIGNASAAVFRRDAYERAGFADESYRLCGDWLLWMKLILPGEVAYLAEPLNYHRDHSGSVRSSSYRNGVEMLERYRILAFLQDQVGPPPEVLEQIREMLFHHWCHLLLYERAIPPRRNRDIYRAATAADPHLRRRLINKIRRPRRAGQAGHDDAPRPAAREPSARP